MLNMTSAPVKSKFQENVTVWVWSGVWPGVRYPYLSSRSRGPVEQRQSPQASAAGRAPRRLPPAEAARKNNRERGRTRESRERERDREQRQRQHARTTERERERESRD